LLGLFLQVTGADGALVGIKQAAFEGVQRLALVELAGDLAAVGGIGQVAISYVESRRSKDDAPGDPAN
jgi:hypothetical protein